IRRRRALGDPLARLLRVDLHFVGRSLALGVIGADDLDEAPVPGRLPVRDDDAKERKLLAADPAKTNASCHGDFLVTGYPGNPPRPNGSFRPAPPVFPAIFMNFCICLNCASKVFTSCTVRPDPLAMRRRRWPLMRSGLDRSFGVIDSTMASTCFNFLSSILAACSMAGFMPGSSPSTFL